MFKMYLITCILSLIIILINYAIILKKVKKELRLYNIIMQNKKLTIGEILESVILLILVSFLLPFNLIFVTTMFTHQEELINTLVEDEIGIES